MLQRVQAEVSELFRLRVGVDCDHAAFVMEFVEQSFSLQPLAFSS